ncbi:MAG: glycosyltransferase family 9 protein [Pseudomonadota bacterium]|nr:glycosyltransferase family 9 protein [Pseudomonadota bacterium]
MSSVKSIPESICIIRLSAIGDCCHTLPVIRTLQDYFPSASVTWIIGKTEYSLLEGSEGIEFITFDKSKGVQSYLDIKKQLSGRKFQFLLHMHASMRANIVSTLVNANRRIGFDRLRARDYQWLFSSERIIEKKHRHVMDGLFEFTENFGIKERSLRWDIPIRSSDKNYVDNLIKDDSPMVVISPCSSSRFRNFRNWSVENYIKIANYLLENHRAQIILTGADTKIEKDYANEISKKSSGELMNLVGKTSLKRLLALIGKADLVICPDSGPAHMAASTGTPVVGLYATSNRLRTGPYFSQHLAVDRYPDAIKTEFNKPIKSLRWGQRVRDPLAMELITVTEVTQKIDMVLGSHYQHTQKKQRLPLL